MFRTENAGRTRLYGGTSTTGMEILSYNLWHHRAADELEPLVDFMGVDLMFLQEVHTERLPESIGSLVRLAASTNNRLGLAVYGDSARFAVEDTRVVRLSRSLHDQLLSPTPHRLVAARLLDRLTGRRFVVASFHAAPLTAGNAVRHRQIREAHAELDRLGGGLPTLLVGDFNHPLFLGGLRRRLSSSGHTLTQAAGSTYARFGVLRGRFDLVAARGLDVGAIRVLPRGKSDHLPIMTTVSYPA